MRRLTGIDREETGFAVSLRTDMRILAAAAILTGLCAVAAGAVLLAVHSPKLEWLSDDYGHEVVLNGTFRILEGSTGQLVEYPVTVSRSQEVIRIDGRKLIVKETRKSTTPLGELPLTFGETVVAFAVDAETHTYAAYRERFVVADELPIGYFTFPPGVRRESEYSIWIEEVMLPLPARYEGSKVVDGLELHTYVIDAEGITVWNDSHSQAPRSGDARIVYSVEPRSGVVVDEQSQITRRYLDETTGWITTFTSALQFTPETVSKNLELAKASRSRLVVLGTWLPWSMLGAGLVLSVGGAVLWRLRRTTAGRRQGLDQTAAAPSRDT
ncbi:MAG: DUF3068 domain-containing protein [Chloroflexi bacterium]|nr:DUF3068 domain-containing protein [Chloroflexota bacterium]